MVAAFAAAGATANVSDVEPDEFADLIARWASSDNPPDVIAIAGGDGTANAALAAAVEHGATIAPLPLGTFNHFAKDLGLPDDLGEAAPAVVAGSERRIDVAEVNGEYFVNNSAIGLYPDMVAIRDELRERHGWGKLRAAPVAALNVFRRLHVHSVTVSADGGPARRLRTPVLFVGNDRFDFDAPGGAERHGLTDGVIQITVTTATSRRRLVAAALRTLRGRATELGEVEQFEAVAVEITADAGRLRVARDGEVGWTTSPLRYRSHPGALRVRALVERAAVVAP